MTLKRIVYTVSLSSLLLLLLAIGVTSGSHQAFAAPLQSGVVGSHCVPIGGAALTNLGGFGPNTTLGIATGDLRGALGVMILSTSQGPGNTTLLHVQHHWVTESGDFVFIDPATATSAQVAPGLFAIVNYPAHLSGGTGKFAGATGDFTSIGEADFNTGHLVLRYSGQVCFADREE